MELRCSLDWKRLKRLSVKSPEFWEFEHHFGRLVSVVEKYPFGMLAAQLKCVSFKLTDVRNHVLDTGTTLPIPALTEMAVTDKAPISRVKSVW